MDMSLTLDPKGSKWSKIVKQVNEDNGEENEIEVENDDEDGGISNQN